MAKARPKLPPGLDGLLRSDLERVIWEANLGKHGTTMATRYFIEDEPQVDIAAEFYMDRSTVSRRLAEIVRKMDKTAQKMGLY